MYTPDMNAAFHDPLALLIQDGKVIAAQTAIPEVMVIPMRGTCWL